jgi:hypothetical protein
MAAELTAVEVTGVVDEAGRLALDEPLRAIRPGRVRLIVLAPPGPTRRGQADAGEPEPDEMQWLAAAATNPAFAALSDPAEDVYTAQDGRAFRDEG